MSSRMAEHLKPGNIDWWPRYEAMLTLAHPSRGIVHGYNPLESCVTDSTEVDQMYTL